MVSGRQRPAVHFECSRLDIVMSHPEGRPLIPWQGEGSLCNFTWCSCVNQFLLTLNILGHKVSLTIPHPKNFVLSSEIYIYICVCVLCCPRGVMNDEKDASAVCTLFSCYSFFRFLNYYITENWSFSSSFMFALYLLFCSE